MTAHGDGGHLNNALEELVRGLRRLYEAAGSPPLKELTQQVGCSRTTMRMVFSGRRVPPWALTHALVETLGGDINEELRSRWMAAVAAHIAATQAAATARPVAPAATSGRSAAAITLNAQARKLGLPLVGAAVMLAEIAAGWAGHTPSGVGLAVVTAVLVVLYGYANTRD